MKQRSVQIVVLFCVLAGGILLYFIFNGEGKRYSWMESYRASSEQPYGTLYIRKMLESYRPGDEFILNEKKPLKSILEALKDPARTDYVFIGENIFLDKESLLALTGFLEEGGDAFIASLTPPQSILDAVYYKECNVDLTFQYNRVASVNLNFFHDSLKSPRGYEFAFRYETEDFPYDWNHINDSVFCDSTRSIVALGHQQDELVNFIKIPAGRGNIYLHSNPLVFTNYFLTKPEMVDYVSAVFSHLDGEHLIWDEYSKIPYEGNTNAYNSPLYYILQQPSLKYAWWLLLLTVILYILFGAKRKQRIIPVREPKTNTSLEFVNLISRLHYKNGNHLDMARKKMRYFLYFVRFKYGIHAERFRDEHIGRLAEKSRVSVNDVQGIFSQYYLIEERFKDDIEVSRLVNLYDTIENFYKQCK
ncbi:MAG: hypothetical protein WEB30_10400 [Cyclobacteriaceae bacterium]